MNDLKQYALKSISWGWKSLSHSSQTGEMEKYYEEISNILTIMAVWNWYLNDLKQYALKVLHEDENPYHIFHKQGKWKNTLKRFQTF